MVYIDKESPKPIYAQIYNQTKQDILSGAIRGGTVLPGTRTLAQSLGVGRNSVNNAYAQLTVEGYIQPLKGVGFVVLEVSESDWAADKQHNLHAGTSQNNICENNKEQYKYDFQFGNFSQETFPVSIWKHYTSEILAGKDIEAINQYQDKQGDLELRLELKKYLKRSRGVNCMEQQIVVGCGLHYLLEIICKLIGYQERIVAMEEPGYHGSRNVFLNNGYVIRPVCVTEKGLDINALQKLDAKAIYVTPSHQFPLGVVMPLQKRKQLLNWAAANNIYIIEDDYDSEFRYYTKPVPSLQSIDYNDCVIYIGTFSKSLSPSLRVNYMVLPNQLLPKYKSLFQSYQAAVSWLNQRILCRYLASGRYEQHLRKVNLIYKKRHDALVQSITQKMGDKIVIHGRGAGMHLFLEFKNGEEQEWLISRAKEYGIKVYPTMPFWLNQSNCLKNTLFVGFSMLDEDQIAHAIALLHKAWFEKD